jgi:hypothetical protein
MNGSGRHVLGWALLARTPTALLDPAAGELAGTPRCVKWLLGTPQPYVPQRAR